MKSPVLVLILTWERSICARTKVKVTLHSLHENRSISVKDEGLLFRMLYVPLILHHVQEVLVVYDPLEDFA